MGLSSSKTTTTSGPSPQAIPYLTAASRAVQGAYDANQGNLSEIGRSLTDAFRAKQTAINGSTVDPNVSAAKGYVGDVLGGKYLTSNPYTRDIIDTTNNDITDRINAIFSRAGQTGSSRQIGELGKQLAANESKLLYDNYNTERGRMDAAVGSAANMDASARQLDNADLATLIALGSTAAETPYLGSKFLSQGLGGLWGNAQTTTQSGGSGLLGSLLNAGATIGSAAIMASDRRVKRDIVKVGELPDGLGVYDYRYIWSDEPQRGVMAEEVAELRPWALGPVIDGIATVNYGAL